MPASSFGKVICDLFILNPPLGLVMSGLRHVASVSSDSVSASSLAPLATSFQLSSVRLLKVWASHWVSLVNAAAQSVLQYLPKPLFASAYLEVMDSSSPPSCASYERPSESLSVCERLRCAAIVCRVFAQLLGLRLPGFFPAPETASFARFATILEERNS